MNDVEWRALPDWEGSYEVAEDGQIRSLDRYVTHRNSRQFRRGRVLVPNTDSRGYLMVSLKRCGVRTPMRIHRAVLLAFVGPRPADGVGRHLNGNPLDNRRTNLAWGTYSDNGYDTVLHGRNEKALRTACPLGHLLVLPNLTAESQRRGRNGQRGRKACHRTSSAVAHAKRKGRVIDAPAIADRHYETIMNGAALPGTAHVADPARGSARVGAAPSIQPGRAAAAPVVPEQGGASS